MVWPYRALWWGAIAAVAAAVGPSCGDDHHSHDEDQFICDGTENPLDPGTQESGSAFTLEIVDADPVPHTTDRNQLRVKLLDAQQMPVTGATFDSITPFAAKHDHGTPVVPQWQDEGNGVYLVTELNYVHRGPWFVTFEITAGGTSDTVRFTFCIRDPAFEDGGMGSS
jgi:hypothetical protein